MSCSPSIVTISTSGLLREPLAERLRHDGCVRAMLRSSGCASPDTGCTHYFHTAGFNCPTADDRLAQQRGRNGPKTKEVSFRILKRILMLRKASHNAICSECSVDVELTALICRSTCKDIFVCNEESHFYSQCLVKLVLKGCDKGEEVNPDPAHVAGLDADSVPMQRRQTLCCGLLAVLRNIVLKIGPMVTSVDPSRCSLRRS